VNQTRVLRLPKTKELTATYRSKKIGLPIQTTQKLVALASIFQGHIAKPITAHKTWPRLVLSGGQKYRPAEGSYILAQEQ